LSNDYTPLPLVALVESLLFVAAGSVTLEHLATALEVKPKQIEEALKELEKLYAGRGLRLQRSADKIQLTTAPAVAAYIERFLGLEALTHLSRPALETLAIIAYKQPVSRPQIESLRGVNCDGVIKSLLSKGLIEEVGRVEAPGRPIIYGTTSEFLQHFGLAAINELPPLEIATPETEPQAHAELLKT
jgi:segregation and condensation protein B